MAVATGPPGDTPQILFDEFARDLAPESATVLERGPELLRAGWSTTRPRVGDVRMQVLIAVHAVCWGETGWEIDESLADRPWSAAVITVSPMHLVTGSESTAMPRRGDARPEAGYAAAALRGNPV